jgi:hypothetical protein
MTTLQDIAGITGGKLARDEESVVVGYGNNGFLRLALTTVITGGEEREAVAVSGKLARREGAAYSELRGKIRDAGLYAC